MEERALPPKTVDRRAVFRTAALWLAFLAPFTSTFLMTLLIGAAVTVAGITQVLQAFRASAWKGFFFNLLVGLAYLVASAFFWLTPVLAAITIAIVLAWLLIASGLSEVALGIRLIPERGWFWFILTGFFSIGAGLWFAFRMPLAGFFLPGFALGMAMIFEGAVFLAHGRGGGGRASRADAAPAPEPLSEPAPAG